MTNIYLNEDAYYRVLKAFAAGTYDLKKEMLLAKLRKELVISDERHEILRAMIEEGREPKERDYVSANATPAYQVLESKPPGHSKRHRESDSSEDEGFQRAGSTFLSPRSPFQPPERLNGAAQHANAGISFRPPAKRQRRVLGDQNYLKRSGIPTASDINELIGYKIRRWWPENGGWFEGAITDYKAATGEHCIVYDMNTPSESYEWFDMSISRADEFKLLSERINIIEHAPKERAPSGRLATPTTDLRPGKIGGGPSPAFVAQSNDSSLSEDSNSD